MFDSKVIDGYASGSFRSFARRFAGTPTIETRRRGWQCAREFDPIHENAAAWGESGTNAWPSLGLRIGVAAVQRADSDGNDQVERRFASGQRELLDRSSPIRHRTGSKFRGRAGDGLSDGTFRAVETEHVSARRNPRHDRTGERAGAAANLEHAQAGAKGQRIEDRLQT